MNGVMVAALTVECGVFAIGFSLAIREAVAEHRRRRELIRKIRSRPITFSVPLVEIS